MRDSLDVCQQILHALGHLPLEAWIPKVVDIQSGTLEKTAPRFLKAEQKPRFSAYGFVGIRHEKTEMYSISSTFMSMYLYMNISHSCDCLHINICVWFFQYTACWNIETHDFYCCMILSYHVSCRWKSNEFCCLSSWFGTCESWVQPDCLTRKKKTWKGMVFSWDWVWQSFISDSIKLTKFDHQFFWDFFSIPCAWRFPSQGSNVPLPNGTTHGDVFLN